MRLLWVLTLLFAGCIKQSLYVQQESLDVTFLASSRVGTPDPRQDDPPCGQRLLIAWNFARALFEENLTLQITVRFWDTSEEKLSLSIAKKRAQSALFFPMKEERGRILTYQVQVVTEDGQIIETWKHPLWTELIQIDN
jgi:hypothetical protein